MGGDEPTQRILLIASATNMVPARPHPCAAQLDRAINFCVPEITGAAATGHPGEALGTRLPAFALIGDDLGYHSPRP